MRIKTVFLIGFVAVAIPGFVSSARMATDSWRSYAQARDATSTAHLLSNAMLAKTSAAVEIGQLSTAAVAANADMKPVDASIAQTDKAIEATRRDLDAKNPTAVVLQET
ncbi:MAG: hypothetical protein JWR89_4681, partial [Tardiphaga sp.]|uniref:hypothetical protein n=1 Tax=Tardiphaga sp. TaxID=1926292 RepID=UPI0026381C45